MSRGKILGDGQYKIGDVLGEGAFSRVYRCYNMRSHTSHAVKVVHMSRLNEREELKDALCREINSMELVSARKSEHVVNMVDKLQSTRNYYIVMDLADGGTLMDLVNHSYQGMSHCRVWNYFVQIVHGLEVIHSSNVVHRDLKPENILLATATKELVKISDFGFACFSPKGRMLFRECGTLKYTAPEVFGDSGYDGRAADVWSLGVTLYVMLFNCVPFYSVHNDTDELKEKIRSGRYTVPRRIPKALAHLLSVMLNTNPKKRWTIEKIKRHVWFAAPDGENGPHPPIWDQMEEDTSTPPVTPQSPQTPSMAFLVHDPAKSPTRGRNQKTRSDDLTKEPTAARTSRTSNTGPEHRRRSTSCPVLTAEFAGLSGSSISGGVGGTRNFSPGSSMFSEIAALDYQHRNGVVVNDLSVTELARRVTSPAATPGSTTTAERSPSHDSSDPNNITPQGANNETPQDGGGGAAASDDFASSSTTSPSASVDFKRFENRPLLRRLSLVHLLICVNFFFIFAALIVTGALRILFDVDATKWKIPNRLREMMERLLTPPTEQQRDTWRRAGSAPVLSPRSTTATSPKGTPKKTTVGASGISNTKPPQASTPPLRNWTSNSNSYAVELPPPATPVEVEFSVQPAVGPLAFRTGASQTLLRHRKSLPPIVIPSAAHERGSQGVFVPAVTVAAAASSLGTKLAAASAAATTTVVTGSSPSPVAKSPPRTLHTPSPRKRAVLVQENEILFPQVLPEFSEDGAARLSNSDSAMLSPHEKKQQNVSSKSDEGVQESLSPTSSQYEQTASENTIAQGHLTTMRRVESHKTCAMDELDLDDLEES